MHQFSCNELSAFFENFSQIKNKETGRQLSRIPDIAGIKEFFQRFADKLNIFRNSGGLLNIFEICGLGHDELRNCAVLAWLLDENGSHGHGRHFLETLLRQCEDNGGMPLISSRALGNGYSTRTEFCPDADNANRVDIVCDGNDFLLYIEVKIDSREHSLQTERYFTKLKNAAGRRETALVFLSPDTPPACGDAKFIRWRDCALALEHMAGEKSRAGASQLSDILSQYADFIRGF